MSNKLDNTNNPLVALQTHNGHYVRAEDGGGGLVVANGNTIGPWETFELIEIGDNDRISCFSLALRTHKGYYCGVEDGDEGLLVASQDIALSSMEIFSSIVKDDLPGLNFLERLFLKRRQDQYKRSQRAGSLESKVDELLAFKAEMVEKIEDTVTFIEQNCFDRRLEDAILFLVGACDGESIQEVMGFNESDSRFGYYLAGWLQKGENLTLKQAETALGMIRKYSQSQLEPNGYSLPTAWEDISHQYHERTIEGELPALSAVLKIGQRIDYCDTFIIVYYPNSEIHESLGKHSEGVSAGPPFAHHIFLDATPGLINTLAEHRVEGYATYVDPDIEAAYYLWQQEQQRNRVVVLPLYALSPDALLLDAVPLESERGSNYQGLRRLLQQQQWYRADQATNQLIEAMCRTVGGGVDEDAVKELPCADLRTIDRLWVAASGGKFGFSVQRKIWLELGITNLDVDNVEDVELDKFRDAVGWLLREKHISYRKSPFDLSTAPNGHFPRWGWEAPAHWGWHYGSVIAATAFQKAKICNLYIPTGEQSE